ncbi:hypothetical protein GCM10020255_063140 [Rhodococcus baikonurensis]
MSDAVLISRTGDVVTWTLNRPDTRNAISEIDMIEALEDAVTAVNRDQSVRAVILTGAGSAFSSGGNVKHMRDKEGMFGGAPGEIRQGYRHGIQRIPLALYTCEVPTIAAVNGPAIGAGCDLSLMCDLRIASTAAVFAESFVKVGLIPGDGGAWLLPARSVTPAPPRWRSPANRSMLRRHSTGGWSRSSPSPRNCSPQRMPWQRG